MTFIKMTGSRNVRYLKLELAEGIQETYVSQGMGLRGALPPTELAASAKSGKGTKSADTPPASSAPVVLHYGIVEPLKYDLMLSAHPDLYKQAHVSLPLVVPAGTRAALTLQLSPFSGQLDLSNFPWEIALFLVE